ncbi:MAG TPA: histidine triad nucleotide-binding protein [Dehalococcoidia bacterium]|nr:histidine triad nucleotide-binding protein [Dehalococcoidia bacterium]
MSDCLFCRIANGEVRAKVLYQDDLVVAFDIPEDQPWKHAPVHFLVIPREHIPSAREAEARHEPALGRLFTVAARVAREMGIEASGYRLASNTGDDAGQTVFHLHLHCLGGRRLQPEG